MTAAAVFVFTLSALFAQSRNLTVSTAASEYMASSQNEASLRAVVSQLSLEEKAAQVLMVNIAGSKTADAKSIASFKGTVPGAVLLFGYNIADTPQAVADFLESAAQGFQSTAQRSGRTFVPPLFALDNEGGTVYRTRRITAPLPAAEEIGKRFSVEETEELYRLLGQQMRELGLHLNLAPVAEAGTEDVATALGTRTFSSEPEQAGQYAAAAVRGMQNTGILAAVKHFPGNSAADLHKSAAELTVDYEAFLSRYCSVFQPSITDDAAAVLISHITVPAVEAAPFCFSTKGIALLRNVLGFSGLIITDDIAMQALNRNGASPEENAVRAIAAGCDMVMCSLSKIYPLVEAIAEKARTDTAFAKRLDEAVLHVLTAKQKVQLIDTSKPICPDGFLIPHTPDWEKFRHAKEAAVVYERRKVDASDE
ncbi:glycoside hydrolase family 3 N-terminal domain-containing protein [Treponema vincentii]|uniref:glycoside hydrolase family 3 N-terminal domain-containing protein n=1 Tax=Treponema TaxID=157 RepID=UPI001E4799B2|nr:glycoside hydrolase family 3 N-terminal domain-containing protein [Treponema vincentii]